MSLKILFVIDNIQFGGGERVFWQIINSLDPLKYKVFLSSQPSGNFSELIKRKRVRFFSLDFSKRINPALIFRLAGIIKKNGIQIVHGQGTRAEFYARIAARLAGKAKYVSTLAMPVEGFDVNPFKKTIYRLLDSFSERYVDRFIVVSDELKEKLVNARGIPSGKVARIYNGIEVDEYRPENKDIYREKIRKEFKVNDNDLFIGAVGRLVWQKGFEYLIRALPEIIRARPDSKVLIVGEGPLKDRLKEQGERLKVENHLIFTGFRSDIKEILSAVDILAIPSLLEGFPMITLEGMAMAKPILATDISGIREQIVDNESGVLIPPCDEHAIAKALLKVINDKAFAEKIGLNARKRVIEELSAEKMIKETEKVYQGF